MAKNKEKIVDVEIDEIATENVKAGKNTLQAILGRMAQVDADASITITTSGLTATMKGKNFKGKNSTELGMKVDVAVEMFAE